MLLLHECVYQNDIQRVHKLILDRKKSVDKNRQNAKQNPELDFFINAQNQYGETPAHIAARLGYCECFQMLIEYDADMSIRNFDGLSPIGEAKMNSKQNIIDLFHCHYVVDKRQEKKLDVGRFFKMDSNLEHTKPEPRYIRRFLPHLFKFNTHILAEMDEIKKRRQEFLEQEENTKLLELKKKYAIQLQSLWRCKKARQDLRRKEVELKSLNKIKKSLQLWVLRHRINRHIRETTSAIKIQSVVRMTLEKHLYTYILHERLWWQRAIRILAGIVQRVWRGHHYGRRRRRLLFAKKSLRDPSVARNYDFWLDIQDQSEPPRRLYGAYKEYVLSGTKDVLFYVNICNKKVQWDKPMYWVEYDQKKFKEREESRTLGFTLQQEESAILLQRLWRAKRARKFLKYYVRANRIARNAVNTYLQNPRDIKALSNYTLYLHVIKHDYEKARPLYYNMLTYMNRRGADNAFILLSYALFSAVTEDEDWDTIKNLAYRGIMCSSSSRDKKNENWESQTMKNAQSHHAYTHVYDLADTGFFRQTAYQQNQNSESWHNYALSRMIVYHDYQAASEYFSRAICLSPQDERLNRNFEVLMYDKEFMGNPRNITTLDLSKKI